jgi:putative ABC transport system permease protein
MESLLQDLRFTARALMRRPGFTFIAALTIALGVGANTAIFTVVNSVLIRPLPYPDADRIVAVFEQEHARGWPRAPGSAEDFLAWREESKSFATLAGMSQQSFNLTGDGAAERITGGAVTGGFFEVFGVSPQLGRTFGREANVAGANRLAVLSHALWMRRFGADANVIGRLIEVNGEPFEVTAVMPQSFRFPGNADLWVPIVFSEAQLQDRNWHFLFTVGRLADGATLAQARTELKTIAQRLAVDHPDSNAGWDIDAFPLHGELVASVRTMLLVLLGAVGFVLLIACANAANLMLVRAAGRGREMAVRAAIGAGRGRLVQQLLTESVLLSALGGAAGLLLALWGVRALVAVSPITVPAGGTVSLDGRVLLFSLLATVVTGLLFGLAPVSLLRNAGMYEGLKDGTRGSSATGGNRLRSSLIVAETALALVLAAGAGLTIQSLLRLQQVDVGVDTENLLVAQLSLSPAEYPPELQALFFAGLLERMSALPGVEAAAVTPFVPPASGPQFHVRIDGVHTEWTMDLPVARFRAVSPGYFEMMGIPLVRGRTFTDADRDGTGLVAIIDQAFADQLFPDRDPIGQSIRTLLDEPREIIGIVGNVANAGVGNDAMPTDYVPQSQTPLASQTLVVRTSRDPLLQSRPVQAVVREMDADLPVYGVGTLEERLAASIAAPRFNTVLLGLFAGLALVLAAVGIYGVMAFDVRDRTREIGLRMALGANRTTVVRMVLRRGLRLTLLGLVIGLIATVALGRIASSLLFGVEPSDPVTLASVAVLLGAVATLASAVPALRASRVDPLLALREE